MTDSECTFNVQTGDGHESFTMCSGMFTRLISSLRSKCQTGHMPQKNLGIPTQEHITYKNDPLSHRIIEKRRRDRMNNCLADLSRLIPTYYLKKGRGRIEKTEIIEMAIKYMKHLQAHACNQIENCEVTTKQERTGSQLEQYHLGYQECLSETMQFLVESEGFFSGDSLCVRLMNHLSKHCEKILSSEGYITRQSGASSSTSSGYHANSSSTGSSSDGNGNGSSHASESKDTLVTGNV
ncbi:hypothetical protein SK128_024216 [Halocaridina rubra]|uniref:Uncharacterized protein n=1 Tax=Halocaridina rubra TaxID=373956 RepID=A0AAN8XIU8_HALRR